MIKPHTLQKNWIFPIAILSPYFEPYLFANKYDNTLGHQSMDLGFGF
jgi:hypothetical protein